MLIKNEMNSTIPPNLFSGVHVTLVQWNGQGPRCPFIRDLTKLRRRRQREKQKKTTLHAFLYISLPSLQQLRREMTNFELTGERERQGDTFCSLWTRTRSPLFSSHLTSLLSSNWVTWYKREKVSKFHRRFHCRCRCRIVRSYFFTEGGKGNASKAIGDLCTQPTRQTPEMRMSFLHSSEFGTSFNSQLFSDLFKTSFRDIFFSLLPKPTYPLAHTF